MTATTAVEEGKENVFIQKLREISQELQISSDLLHLYVAKSEDRRVGDKLLSWYDVNVDFHCTGIKIRLAQLKTLCPVIVRKKSYETLIEKSEKYKRRRFLWIGEKYDNAALEQICIQTGKIIVFADFLREKAEGYEYAKENLGELSIEKLVEPLREHKNPTQIIEGYLNEMNEHLRRKGQIQYLIDAWEHLTNELEFFGMVELSKVSRAYMEFFDAKYEETDSLEVVEKSHRKQLNRLLNKVSRTLTSYKTPL